MFREQESAKPAAERSRISHHQVSDKDFDAIAAGADDRAVLRRLRMAERSYRHLALRAVLDVARRQPSAIAPLPPLDTAWDLLVAAEQTDPASVAPVLDRPQTGGWVSRVLRRMLGGLHDDVPLWVDLGYLHCLAVSAAIRAGARFELEVPLRRGILHIPTLGSTRIGEFEVWSVAAVSSDGRSAHAVSSGCTVRIPAGPDRGSAHWDFPIRLRAEHRGRQLAVHLDSVDPFRGFAVPALPEKLDVAVTKHWEALLQSAWTHLVEQDERAALALAEGVLSLVPLPRAERFRERSASSGDSFGSIVLSLPDTPAQFAATLVHEAQHVKLGVLLHLFPLVRDDGRELVYAPWRDDPRPLQGLLQGIFAHFGVAGFWRTYRNTASGAEAAAAHFEFALWRRRVRGALILARKRAEVTALGQRFLTGIETTIMGYLAEPVPPPYADLAELADRDHLAGWRIHHLTPPEALVRSLAGAWREGADPGAVPAPGPSRLTRDGAVRDLDTRAVLIRYWLADRATFRQLERSGQVDRHVTGATSADLHLIAGRADAARGLYLAQLGTPVPGAAAWTGLGLALLSGADRRSAAAARALLARPELVRAVSRAVEGAGGGRPPILDLAAWLGELPKLDEV
jgi:HEXXH motif-containing protein